MLGLMLVAFAVLPSELPLRAPPEPQAVVFVGPDRQVTTYADDPLSVQQVVLDNGLTVLLSENHQRPEIFGAVVVRTGAKNDPPDNTGIAHYLEHMLFKGTTDLGTTNWEAERPLQAELERLYDQLGTASPEQRKTITESIGKAVQRTYAYAVPSELDQLLEQIGGTGVNAFTTYDETVYYNTFPASQLEPWAEIYAHRFTDPVFRLFPTELEAVYEEKNIAIDTTGYELFRQFMRAAFPGHPYGTNDILGEVEHLKRPSLRAMMTYYGVHYVPANMALVLSGDFDAQAILPVLERHFGTWKAGPAPKAALRDVPPFEPGQRLSVRLTPVRAGALAFHTVPESHPDYAALALARRLLSNDQRSGLIDRLSDDGKVLIAQHVAAEFADHNLDVIVYVPRILTQSFRGAERVVMEQFERLAAGRFDDALFRATKEGLIAEETAKWEDNEERALAIGHAFVARGGWRGHLEYLEILERMTKADVMRVAARLFGPRRLTVRSRMGFPKKTRLEKPSTPPVTPRRGAHSKFFKDVQTRPGGPPRIDLVDFEKDVQSVALRDGVTIETNPNPFNDLYHLELRFGVGDDAIRELGVLAEYLGRIGTQKTPTARFRRKLFELSTTLTASTTADQFIVRLDGPQHHMKAALGLLAELMQHAKGERRPLRQLRRETWGLRHISRKDPAYVGRALREHVLYGDNSDFHREYGPTGMRGLSPRSLIDAWQEVQGYAVEIGYVGRQSTTDVAAMVTEHVPLRQRLAPAKQHIVYPRQLPSETTVYFVPHRNAVQTQLWFAIEGSPVRREDMPAADAFSEYLGGSMAGLVFQEIREFRALAYSAYARYQRDESSSQQGHLLGYVGCQADKTFEATDVMLGLLTDMPQKRERLGFVRSALVRSQETETPSFRDLQDKIEQWEWMGLREDPRGWLVPAYERLDFADIARFYSQHVAGRPVAIMVVGDPRKVKPKDLRKYGKVVRLREGALFSR